MRKIFSDMPFFGTKKTIIIYLGAVVILIFLFAILTSVIDEKAVRDQENAFNMQQSLQTLVAGKGIEQHFDDRVRALKVLTEYSLVDYENGSRSASSLEQLFRLETQTYPEYLAFLYVKSRNDPGFVYHNDTAMGIEAQRVGLLWAWMYYDELGTHPEKTGLWVPPMVVNRSDQLIGLVLPVSVDREIRGVLVVVEDMKPVIERYIVPMRSGQYGSAYLLDSQGNILFDHETDIIGRNIFDGMHSDYPDVVRMDRKMMEQNTGIGEYQFTDVQGGEVTRKLVAWYSVLEGGQKLVVALAAPGSEIDTNLANFHLQRNLLSGALGMLLILTSVVFFYSRQQMLEQSARNLQQLVAVRTRELTTSEEALRSSSELLRALIDVSPLAIVQVDVDDRIILWNPACERIFGWTPADILGKANPIVPLQKNDEYSQLTSGLAKGNSITSFETIRQRKDGSLVWVSISSSPLHDNHGHLRGRMAIFADIGLRKKAEQALRESEQKFRSFIEGSSEGFALFDDNGLIVEWNPALEQLTGISRREILGKSYKLVNQAQSVENANNEDLGQVQQAIETGNSKPFTQSLELVVRDEHGKQRFLNQTVFPVHVGESHWVGSVVHDVTLQKQAEAEVLERNQELESIGKILNDLAANLNLNLIIRQSVEGTLALTGLESGSIYLVDSNQNQLRFVAGKDGARDLSLVTGSLKSQPGEIMFRHAAETGKIVIYDSDEQDRAGAIKPQETDEISFMAVFPLHAKAHVIGVLGLFTRSAVRPTVRRLEVVTQLCSPVALAIENALLYQQTQTHAVELEQRVSERTAQLENAVHELESFSYSVSHDLRSPLRSISGFSQLLTEEFGNSLDDVAKDYLNRIRLSSQRMADLIDDLLNLARMARSDMNRETVNLSVLAQNVIDELRIRQPQREVMVTIQPDLWADADLNLMRVVMTNLVENAWKFTSRLANATIEIGAVDAEEPRTFFVRDNGAGFDPRYTNKLFGAFQRLHAAQEFEGTGIGLATVQRIIHRHGGRIWAESEPEKGAVFYFTLKGS